MIATLLGLWLAGAAHAADPPVCEALTAPARTRTTVAWIAPARRSLASWSWITVVQAADLRAWIAREDADLARVLQGVGERRSSKPPKRPWVVGILEVDVDDLCRPVVAPEAPADLAGVAVCDRQDKRVGLKHGGCGYTTDRLDGRRGLDVFRIRWRDAAATGFCVLPAERFLQGE